MTDREQVATDYAKQYPSNIRDIIKKAFIDGSQWTCAYTTGPRVPIAELIEDSRRFHNSHPDDDLINEMVEYEFNEEPDDLNDPISQ